MGSLMENVAATLTKLKERDTGEFRPYLVHHRTYDLAVAHGIIDPFDRGFVRHVPAPIPRTVSWTSQHSNKPPTSSIGGRIK